MGGNKMKSLIFFLSLLLVIVLSHFTLEALSIQAEALATALGENTTRAVERSRGSASTGGASGSGGHGSTGGGAENGGASASGSGYGSGMPNLGVTPADHPRNNGGNRNHKKGAAVGRSCSVPLVVLIVFSSAAALIGAPYSV